MVEPKLRFKEENGVQFPDWEEKTFNDIADYKKGPFGSALKKKIFVPKSNSTVKVYEQQNAISKDWRLERYFVTDEYFQANLKSFSVSGGDIIVSCAGTIGEVYELPNDAEKGIINQALMRVRIKKSVINSMVFKCVFDKMISSEGIKISNGSALKNIPPFADMKKQPVFLPSLPEQQKISSLFTELDTLIQSAEKELEGYRELKQGMLQKMFPKKGEKVPEIRFPEFTGDWEQRKLKEILIQRTDHQKISDDAPLLAFSYAEGVISPEDKKSNKRDFIMTDKYNKIFSRTELNDIIYNPANVIHGAIHRNKLGTGVVSPIYKIFMCNGVSPKFIGERLHTDRFILEATKFIEGTVVKLRTLSPEMFLEMSIEIPKSYEEQDKIGTYFTNLDNLITLQQKELDGYKELKKGLLQQMFC